MDYGEHSGGFRQQRSFAPVNVGDEVEVTIETVGEKGDGLAKIKGFVLFIPNAKAGETVRVRITRVLKKVGFAEIIGPGSGNAEHAQKKAPSESEDSTDEEEYSEEESMDEEEAFEGE